MPLLTWNDTLPGRPRRVLVAGTTEWQYTAKLGDILHSRADCVLWLDHPRGLVMRQVVGRTLARRIQRRQLWNGNVEPPLWTVFTDPEHVVRWAWRTQGGPGERVAALLEQRGHDVVVVRLRGRRQVARWASRNLCGQRERW